MTTVVADLVTDRVIYSRGGELPFDISGLSSRIRGESSDFGKWNILLSELLERPINVNEWKRPTVTRGFGRIIAVPPSRSLSYSRLISALGSLTGVQVFDEDYFAEISASKADWFYAADESLRSLRYKGGCYITYADDDFEPEEVDGLDGLSAIRHAGFEPISLREMLLVAVMNCFDDCHWFKNQQPTVCAGSEFPDGQIPILEPGNPVVVSMRFVGRKAFMCAPILIRRVRVL